MPDKWEHSYASSCSYSCSSSSSQHRLRPGSAELHIPARSIHFILHAAVCQREHHVPKQVGQRVAHGRHQGAKNSSAEIERGYPWFELGKKIPQRGPAFDQFEHRLQVSPLQGRGLAQAGETNEPVAELDL